MVNYSKKLDKILEELEKEDGKGDKTLLLHSCCAPCSSYVLEYLREFFHITVFYYNPNITEDVEYRKRVEEQKRLIHDYNKQVEEGNYENMYSTLAAHKIEIIEGDYEPEEFHRLSKGLEKCPEGGGRCEKCFALRLRKTAQMAAAMKFDYFTTTLTISPLKNAQKLNEIGECMASEYAISFLPSDFKKKNGYKRSVELSVLFDLYRQNYCGCIYSKAEADNKINEIIS